MKLTYCPRGLAFFTYAARLSASSCRSQLNNGFQLVKMRLAMLDRVTRHDLSGYLIAALHCTTLCALWPARNLRDAGAGYSAAGYST